MLVSEHKAPFCTKKQQSINKESTFLKILYEPSQVMHMDQEYPELQFTIYNKNKNWLAEPRRIKC